jgi:hypothetical protein
MELIQTVYIHVQSKDPAAKLGDIVGAYKSRRWNAVSKEVYLKGHWKGNGVPPQWVGQNWKQGEADLNEAVRVAMQN